MNQKEIARVQRSRQEAQATYDKISQWYDLLEGMWEKKLRQASLKKLSAREENVILEIGFGPGHEILALARAVVQRGQVYGIDLSSRMVALAQARVKKAGLCDRVMLNCGDALQLPFEDEFFDALFMSFTLELFDTPEIPTILCEAHRVLKPGGRICVVSLSRAGGVNWMVRLYEWGHQKFSKLLDCRPIYAQKAIEDAGFQTVDASLRSNFGLPVEIVLAAKPT